MTSAARKPALPKADRVFNALGDPTRRAIVERLSRGPSSVSKLAAPLDITLTAVRQHLDVLEACGFETKGLTVLETWVREQRSMWEQALDRLGDVLDEEDE
jgi:DNA-binding transcriptional ArsR family regulator